MPKTVGGFVEKDFTHKGWTVHWSGWDITPGSVVRHGHWTAERGGQQRRSPVGVVAATDSVRMLAVEQDRLWGLLMVELNGGRA